MPDMLAHLFNSCRPTEPATAEQYVDLNNVRGDNAFTKQITNALRLAANTNGAGVQYVRAPFSGHIGAGKSSELEHLKETLIKQRESPRRLLPVLMNSSEYVDPYDADVEDVLVAITTELAEQVRQHTDLELKDTYLQKRLHEIVECLATNVEADEGEVGAGGVKLKLRLGQQSAEDRRRIREAFRPKLPTFLGQLNIAFDDVRRRLRQSKPTDKGAPYSDFVLIADGLEKVMRAGGQTDPSAVQRRLFLEGGTELAKLEAHAIWTVPLTLARACPGELQSVFGRAAFVLPMVKTEHRGQDHNPYAAGREQMERLVAKRANPCMIADLFAPDSLHWMIAQSGGDARCLMTFIQAACLYVDKQPVTMLAAQRAVNQTATAFAPAIGHANWHKLAQLELSLDQQADNRDPDVMEMLRQTWILEYLNGDDDGDIAPWYAVHPVIRRLTQFKRAVEIEREKNGGQQGPNSTTQTSQELN